MKKSEDHTEIPNLASGKDKSIAMFSTSILQASHIVSSEKTCNKNYRIMSVAALYVMIHPSIQIAFSHFTVTADKDGYSKDYCN